MTTNHKPSYLDPEEVRTWVRDYIDGDPDLNEMAKSGNWGKVSRVYHQVTDAAIDYFRAHLGDLIEEKHFARIVLDHIDPNRINIGKPHGPETEWPRYDPERFQL